MGGGHIVVVFCTNINIFSKRVFLPSVNTNIYEYGALPSILLPIGTAVGLLFMLKMSSDAIILSYKALGQLENIVETCVS